MQSDSQLIYTAQLFIKLGKVPQARKIARKLIEGHKDRLSTLCKVSITKDNYSDVMSELNEIQYLVKR